MRSYVIVWRSIINKNKFIYLFAELLNLHRL